MAARSFGQLQSEILESATCSERGQSLRDDLASLGLKRDHRLSVGASSGNAIIQGENLTVLQALRDSLSGVFQCIYLDPPYNNQESYNHYDDDLCHQLWLDKIAERLTVLDDFLSPEGSIWISIDDREMHHLKVRADRIFGRENYISTIVWQHRTTRENRKVFSNNHEYLLVYAKNPAIFKKKRNLLPPSEELVLRYRNPDNDPRGPWQSVTANVQGGHGTRKQYYKLVAPNGKVHLPPPGRCWVYSQERMQDEIALGNIWFGNDGNGVPRIKLFLESKKLGLTPQTLWTADEVGTTDDAKKHILGLFPGEDVFDTPKPETLIERILDIATETGDLVLDPYLGSGTTSAVAHKMGRSYMGIEQGSHAVTLCADRMKLVVEGESGGISSSVGWSGGGSFDFYRRTRRS